MGRNKVLFSEPLQQGNPLDGAKDQELADREHSTGMFAAIRFPLQDSDKG